MMIFDNCLNNPADGWRQTATEDKARGATGRNEEPPNGLYMYSSVPGRVAPDGPPGQNSPFGAAFLRVLDGSDVDLRTLTARVNREVIIASAGRQICSFRNAYAEPYVLRTSPPVKFPPAANPLAAKAGTDILAAGGSAADAAVAQDDYPAAAAALQRAFAEVRCQRPTLRYFSASAARDCSR